MSRRANLCNCASLLLCAATLQRAATAQSAREHGAALFRERGCLQCHTVHGEGGHKGPDLSSAGRRWSKSMLREQILHGGGAMPAFGDVLAVSEVDALVRYLQHCRDRLSKPMPPQLP